MRASFGFQCISQEIHSRDIDRKNILVTKYVSRVDKNSTLLLRAPVIKAYTRAILHPHERIFTTKGAGVEEEEEERFLIKRVQIALECSPTRLRSARPFTRARARTRVQRPDAKRGKLFLIAPPAATSDFH